MGKTKRLNLFMGQKTHPIGLRLGINQRPSAYWYAQSHEYTFFVNEDQQIRNYLFQKYHNCSIASIKIERRETNIRLNILVAQIRSLIGTKGEDLEQLRKNVLHKCQNFRQNYFHAHKGFKTKPHFIDQLKLQIFVHQVSCPNANAKYLANFIVLELEKRIPF